MARPYVLLAVAALGAVAACGALEPEPPARRTLVVQHHLVECMGPWHQLCLLVRAPGEPEFLRHYGGIEGFEYRWGYVYELEVADHRVANPPADGSSMRTVLRRVVARERVPTGTEFEIFLTSGEGRVVEVAPDRYRFYDAAELTCSAGAACADLRSRIAEGARIRYRLRQPADPALPLGVVQWEICDAALVGSASCSS